MRLFETAFVAFAGLFGLSAAGDINRQSIVFYRETPDVFYCPQENPISLEGKAQFVS